MDDRAEVELGRGHLADALVIIAGHEGPFGLLVVDQVERVIELLVASGLVLDQLIPGLLYLRGDMQIAHMVHATAAVLMICVFLGHIYLGTIGMRGAYSAMKTGYVDEGWAAEHHKLWYDDIKAGKIPAQRTSQRPPPAKPVDPAVAPR